MKLLPTIEKAKKEIEKLEAYITLVENYKEDTLEQKILKTYAYTGSIQKVKAEINTLRANENLPPVDSADISNVINSKSNDQLHKMLKTNYLRKTKGKRKK